MEKRDTRKLKPEVQEELRKQAVRLRKNGMSYREIGEVLGVSMPKKFVHFLPE